MLSKRQTATITTVSDDLAWITSHWQDLHELRVPGTRRRTLPAPLVGQAREAADALARIERHERGRDGILGASQAPMDVGVLGTLTDLLRTAHALAQRTADTAGAPAPADPRDAYDYPAIGALLLHATRHLADATEVDHEALDDAADTAARMRRTLARALGEVYDGHLLTGICPWCLGTTTHRPHGGARTLTVRVVVGQPVIVCEGVLCSPPVNVVSMAVRGRPAWPEHRWAWLADRVLTRAEADQRRRGRIGVVA